MSLSSDDQELVFKKKKGTKNAANRKRKISDEAGVGGQSQSGGWSQSGQDKDTDTEKVFSSSSLLASSRKGRKYGGKQDDLTSNTIASKPLQQHDMSALGVAFKSSGTASTLFDSAATRTIDIDGIDKDDQKVLSGEAAEKMDGLYQGQSNYKEFVNKRQEKITQANAGGLRAGPLKGLSGVRISSRFDYAPAICKDYKETGYCGFGDSCVFMHDRGDYKMGWQLDKEWEEQQRQAAEETDPNKYFLKDEEEGDQVGNEADSDDDLPFACLICRKDFKNPVVTRCKHYFCESCALKRFAKSPACFACNANTAGVFNVAPREFKVKLEQRKKRMEERTLELAAAAAIVHSDQEEHGAHD